MDLVNSCKEKLAYFRIKELKDVLTQLGLSKQGKKQDLVDRILNVLLDAQGSKAWPKRGVVGRDEAAKLVDDIYRKMQVSGTDLASKAQCVLDSSNSNTKLVKGEPEDSFPSNTKVRCPCGSTLETESMIKCEDPRCQVWQHIGCVIVADKPMEGSPQVPEVFYCEICRLSRADPFWTAMAHPLSPVKLATTNIPTDGTNPVQNIEKSFHLTRADKDLLNKPEIDVQAWCMLLHDKVPFRMQWPQYADLQVNGVPVRAINRPGSQLLGANGRDDGPIITPCTKDGINKISLSGCDARSFCLGVRIVKRRTLQQILGLIPKESDGEHFEDALARVCRCVGGGAPTDGADSDSDLEVVADSITVNLRCPWQCPICLKNYSLDSIIVDPYFNRVTNKMRHCGEDITEIEVKPNGSWRVKTKTEAERREVGELAQWHNPDGTLCSIPNEVVQSEVVETGKQVKQEGNSEGHGTINGLKLGLRKNRDGLWVVSKHEGMNGSSGNKRLQPENFGQKVIPMTSSGTGSGHEGEDPSVNQDGNLDFNNNSGGMELDSLALNIDPTYPLGDLQHGPTSINGYSLGPDTDMGHVNLVPPDTSVGRSDGNDGLVDNPLAFEEDPSLQLFLPTRPSDSSMHSNVRDHQVDVSSNNGGLRSEDWISLRLGGSAATTGGGGHVESVPLANGSLTSRQSMPPNRDGTMDSLADTG
ncbi:unnamed protein product [Linum tenue]|uniref:SAP domain-containing protein n=1 Tax=Linum tenue TaxID=586396 RepID=A0AAV0QWJ3_9ROSI|nr:unnamed protein product [Linum tenue]